MLYQLPNGKVIEISTEQYLEMTDEELEYLIAYNYGEIQEDPWFGSVLLKQEKENDIVLPEITEISETDKFLDLDVEDLDNIVD